MPNRNIKSDLFYRDPSAERFVLSWNDWWGFGFLYGILGHQPREGTAVRYYCGSKEAHSQFIQGARHARSLNAEVKP